MKYCVIYEVTLICKNMYEHFHVLQINNIIVVRTFKNNAIVNIGSHKVLCFYDKCRFSCTQNHLMQIYLTCEDFKSNAFCRLLVMWSLYPCNLVSFSCKDYASMHKCSSTLAFVYSSVQTDHVISEDFKSQHSL